MKKQRIRREGWLVPAAVWWMTVAFLLFTVVYPLIVLVINSFLKDGHVSLANYLRIFSDVSIRMSDRPRKGLAAMAEGVEECCAGGMFIRNVKHLVLDRVRIEGTAGPAYDLDQIDRIEEGHS